MPFKVVFRFAAGDHGWTETFYMATGTLDNTGSLALHQGFVTTRLECSPPTVGLQSITSYDVTDSRRSKSTRLDLPGTALGQVGDGQNMYYTEVAARFGMTSISGANRKYWLRGLYESGLVSKVSPLGVVEIVPRPGLKARLDALEETIKGRYYIQHVAAPTGENQAWRVLRIERTPGGYALIRTNANNNPFANKQVVYIRGLDWCQLGWLRGKLPVLGWDTDSVTVMAKFPVGQDDINVSSGAWIRPHQYEYSLISSCNFEEISDHDTGKKQGLPVGRSSGPKCRQSTLVGNPLPG